MSKKQFIKKQNIAVGCIKRAKNAKRDFLYASNTYETLCNAIMTAATFKRTHETELREMIAYAAHTVKNTYSWTLVVKGSMCDRKRAEQLGDKVFKSAGVKAFNIRVRCDKKRARGLAARSPLYLERERHSKFVFRRVNASRQKQYLRSCRTSFINSLSLFVYAVSSNALASQLAALPAAASKLYWVPCTVPVINPRMKKKHLLQRQRTACFPQRKIAGTERQYNHANSAAPVRRKKICSERKLYFPKVFCSENAAGMETSACFQTVILYSPPFSVLCSFYKPRAFR